MAPAPLSGIEIARGLGDRLGLGLLQGFFEAPRQGVASRLLGGERGLEDGFAAPRLLVDDALRVVEFGAISTGTGFVPDVARLRSPSTTSMPPQHGQVNVNSLDKVFAIVRRSPRGAIVLRPATRRTRPASCVHVAPGPPGSVQVFGSSDQVWRFL